MALRGTLRDFGLADIFQLIGIQRKTGVLQLATSDRKVTVSFLSGSVVSADCTRPALEERLGSLLVSSGKVTEKQLADALRTQKTSFKRLGRILLDQKVITTEDLREALQLQVTQIVYNLFRWRDGEYDFSQEETIDYDREHFQPIPAENILMEGARMIDEWPIIERRIPDFKMTLRRNPEMQGAMSTDGPVSIFETDIDFVGSQNEPRPGGEDESEAREALNDDEAAILRFVDGRSSVQEIIDRCQKGEFETCRILYELMSRGFVQAGEETPRIDLAAALPKGSSLLRFAQILIPMLAAVSLATSFQSPLSPVGGSAALDPFGVERIRSHLSQARVGRIDRALRLYYLDRQSLPNTLDPLVAEGFLTGRDLDDPWGRPYLFQIRPSGYSITGFSPDGRPDGTISAESRFRAPDRLALEGGTGEESAGGGGRGRSGQSRERP